MFVDVGGRLWVRGWSPTFGAGNGDMWTAFDSTGRLLGRLAVPGGTKEKPMSAVQFGRDEVFVRRTDDDGATHLTASPLIAVKR
jgi:hypothetical protein